MAEPISLDEARAHLRVTDTNENDLITALIIAAREWVENFTGLILVEREITQYFDGFGDLRLFAWPIEPDATVVVSYADPDGATQTVTDPILLAGKRPAMLARPLADAWPAPYGRPASVWATFTAGYADAAAVPQTLKQAMLMLIGEWFAGREANGEAPEVVMLICRSYRLPVIG